MNEDLLKEANKEKRSAVVRLLEDEYMLVDLIPATAGVVLPSHLSSAPSIRLKLSRLFRGALQVKDPGIEAELLFGDTYFSCVIPFEAIWRVESVKGAIFTWEITLTNAAFSDTEQQAEVAPPPPAPKRPQLRRVK